MHRINIGIVVIRKQVLVCSKKNEIFFFFRGTSIIIFCILRWIKFCVSFKYYHIKMNSLFFELDICGLRINPSVYLGMLWWLLLEFYILFLSLKKVIEYHVNFVCIDFCVIMSLTKYDYLLRCFTENEFVAWNPSK